MTSINCKLRPSSTIRQLRGGRFIYTYPRYVPVYVEQYEETISMWRYEE